MYISMEQRLKSEVKINKLVIIRINGTIRCKKQSKVKKIDKILYQIHALIDNNNGDNIDNKISILETDRIYIKELYDDQIEDLMTERKALQDRNKVIKRMLKHSTYSFVV